MAFYSSQNIVTFDGTDDARSYGVKVLQTVYKTIVEASTKEKTGAGRGSNYWFLDTTRNGGSYDAVPGSSDGAIYDYTNSNDYAGLGMFLKNAASETLFLFFSTPQLDIGDTQGSYNIIFNPMVGSGYYSDNGHIRGFGFNDVSVFYGLGFAVSKNDFNGQVNPWSSTFFTDGDLKPVTDGCNDESGVWYNGETLNVVAGVDGKSLLVSRRLSYRSNVDQILIYGDFLSNNDVTDTQIDCILALQQYSSSNFQLSTVFRDKSGSTTWNPNGSSYSNMRRTVASVNNTMIDGSNTNRIPFTGISFGFENIDRTDLNTILNANGVGYKGVSDTNKIRVVPCNAMITNKSVYNSNWVCIASFGDFSNNYTKMRFKLLVSWDADNDPIV